MNKVIKNPFAYLQKVAMATLCMVCALFFMFLSCGKSQEHEYEIYENHDISVCGVNDPLQNIEWLKEYCSNIKERKDISPVQINLYKIIDTDEYIFVISSPVCPLFCNEDYEHCCIKCNGVLYYHNEEDSRNGSDQSVSLVPPHPWLADKKFVAKLFHFNKIVKQ